MATPPLRRTEVAARDIRVGDRMHRNGRTRFAAKNVRPDRVLWRVTTTGARSPSISSYDLDEIVTVWRPDPATKAPTR